MSAVAATLDSFVRPNKQSSTLDMGVLDTINKLGDVFERGVHKIEWIVPQHNGTKRLVVQYVPEVRKEVASRIKRPEINVSSNELTSTIEGTLELMEGKCRISPLVGPPMSFGFEEGKAEEVHEAMRKSVKVNIDPKTRKIEHIEIQQAPSGLGASFFEAKTIDQLIAEQGVRPVTDFTAFSGAFPDEDIDDMLADIYADRTA